MKLAFVAVPTVNRFPGICLLLGFLFCVSLSAKAQAVTEIITDYNGYWRSASASVNPVKPDNAHNLLGFTYNGVRYSTGVNDNLLAAKAPGFQQADFWSLPVSGISGTISSNTKVGLGALYDGVLNGASNPTPEWGISTYLTDGIKGLGLGTCIANLPVGYMSFRIDNIRPGAIGDGIPDILVTQVADPTGSSYDRYEFTDANGVRIGTYKDIVFTNISPVGNWTADFYEAANKPLTLQAGFTQTDRPLRLWSADLSEFGITVDNYQQISNFRINLCGNSDVAFVAYNNNSIDFNNVLPVQYNFLKGSMKNNAVEITWQTASEQDADRFVVERSSNGNSFVAIGSVEAKNAAGANNYLFTDAAPLQGTSFYRLKQHDRKGGFHYSSIVKISNRSTNGFSVQAYPNPARTAVTVQHPALAAAGKIFIYHPAGGVVAQQAVSKNALQTTLQLAHLPAGQYFLSVATETQTTTIPFAIR